AGVGGVPAPLRVLDGVRQRADGAFGGRVGGDEVGALGRRGPGAVGGGRGRLGGPGHGRGAGRGLRCRARRGGEGFGEAAELHVDDEDRLGGGGGRGRAQGVRERGVTDRALPHGRDGGDDDGVAGVVGQGPGQRVVEVGGRGGGGEVPRGLRAQALGEAGVVGEQAQGLGVAEDRDPGTAGQRLAGEEEA